MKKLLLFVAVASVALFAACAKDRTCTCTETYTDTSTSPAVSVTQSYTTAYTKAKKHDARENCLSYTKTSGTTTDKVDCTLK